MLILNAKRFGSLGPFILFAVIPAVMILGFYHRCRGAGAFAARGQEKNGEEDIQKNFSHLLENPQK